MNSFDSFQLPTTLAGAIARLGFQTPTPIQQKAIPLALQGKDLIGCAQTGTGKTAAFCIPILTQLLRGGPESRDRFALVLVPTRELARQIEEFWVKLSSQTRDFGCASLIGGMAMFPQVRALKRKPRLIIATPGRLIDHIERRTIDVSKVSILVLDEADRMLDMGFEPQLSRIAKFLPSHRQTLLFSATMPPEAERLSAKFVRQPMRVSVGEISRAADKVSQNVVMTDGGRKNELLLDQINGSPDGSILVFTRTKSRTDRVAKYLTSYGLGVARLHGGRSQGQRNAALDAFRSGEARIMVATDIAARGIDVASVGYVINYDLPQVAEDYVHRIGRTGRAGAAGHAISLVAHEERGQWRDILSLLKKTGSTMPVEKGRPQGQAHAQAQPQQRPQQPKAHAKPQHKNTPPPWARSGRGKKSRGRWNRSGKPGHSGQSGHSGNSGHSAQTGVVSTRH